MDNNYNGNYNIDPDNNSYNYTGSSEETQSTYETYTQPTVEAAYTSNSQTGTNDRYYSPYERGTQNSTPKKKGGFFKTLAKTACIAAVFGLVSGSIFGAVNYFIPGDLNTTVAVNDDKDSSGGDALVTTDKDNGLKSTQNSIAAVQTSATNISGIVEDVMPSIVAITNMSQTQVQNWFGQVQQYESESAGSGIIVSEDDESLYIATNNHVVQDATTLTVQFCDDTTAAAEVKGTSSANDLAVVEVKKKDIDKDTLSTIKIATINKDGNEKVGEQVIAIGNALGYGQSVTQGIISALDREVSASDSTTGETTTATLTQTDASINPGNSGGALLNLKGEVIGINSAKYGGDYVDGMGFAIPMKTAANIINELIVREKVEESQTAYLGISGIDVTSDVAKAYNMPTGIYVAKVYNGSAADTYGLMKGDIITHFAGQKVESMEALQELMQYHAAGTEVTITVARANMGSYEEVEINMVLGSKN